MPKVIIKRGAGKENSIIFRYPDLDAKDFVFDTLGDAQRAIKLARYVQANDISLKDISYEN
jgi:hypothetical protein